VGPDYQPLNRWGEQVVRQGGPMRQRFIPPREEEDDLVVPEGWCEMAKEHWRVFLPKRYARLQAEGKLDEEAAKAARITAREMRDVMNGGFSESEAWQAFRGRWIFLPSEEEQPDPWTPNLDPEVLLPALTRVCSHYCDEGSADYEKWATSIREEISEEIGPHLEKAWEAVTGHPPVSAKKAVSWNEIRNVARILFNVWVNEPEIKWARKAWLYLRAKGLTSYRNEAERTMVLVRLGTLALAYREFCDLAFGEGSGDFDYIEWDELGIDPSSLAQLVAPETESDGRDDSFDTDDALQQSSQRVRPEIYDALVDGFGGDAMLFASLWRTPTDCDPRAEESIDDVFNELTASKAEAFQWIRDGMDQLH